MIRLSNAISANWIKASGGTIKAAIREVLALDFSFAVLLPPFAEGTSVDTEVLLREWCRTVGDVGTEIRIRATVSLIAHELYENLITHHTPPPVAVT